MTSRTFWLIWYYWGFQDSLIYLEGVYFWSVLNYPNLLSPSTTLCQLNFFSMKILKKNLTLALPSSPIQEILLRDSWKLMGTNQSGFCISYLKEKKLFGLTSEYSSIFHNAPTTSWVYYEAKDFFPFWLYLYYSSMMKHRWKVASVHCYIKWTFFSILKVKVI